MSDKEQIESVVQLYIDSMDESSADKVKEAFHPNASVVGYLHGDFMEMSVDDFAGFVSSQQPSPSAAGENVVFDIDWQGADQIKNKKLDYKLITFFILPPSKKVLLERLSNRDMKDKLIAEERMKQFGRDVLHWINYDYVVINENLEDCYSKILNLINAEMSNGSKDYDSDYIRAHVEKLTS